MNLKFGPHTLFLHPSGTLLWPKQNMLIVSDLHLEKGSHYARRGFFLPPYDSHETLERLLQVCRQEGAVDKILILGDCFHDEKGYHRLGPQEAILFNQLKAFQPIWIKGNHDGDYVPDGFTPYEEYILEGITFRHEAAPGKGGLEISGHYHPKASFTYKGETVRQDCFIEDGEKLILPAFGAYTGGLDIADQVIQSLFPNSFQTHILGTKKVITINGNN